MRRVALLLLCCAAAGGDWSEDHARFKKAYTRNARPEERRQALLDLGKADVAEAAELLVKTWRTLDRDVESRRRELSEIRAKIQELDAKARDRKTSSEQRQAIRKLVGDLDREDTRQNRILAGIELEQSAILEALRAMRSEGAVAWMAKEGLERARDPVLLHALAVRVASVRDTGPEAILAALRRVKREEQIVPLLQALGREGGAGGEAAPVLLEYLEHRSWVVRVAAAHALAAVATPECVGPLVRALQAEAAGSRAQREVSRALVKLTGANYGLDADLWARWWKDNRAKAEAGKIPLGQGPPRPRPGEKADQGHFYGIPQDFKRAIYVLDVSGSMQVSMEDPRWEEGVPIPARQNEDSRFEAAKRELFRAIKNLHRESSYAVLLYSSHVSKLHDALVPAVPEELQKVTDAVDRLGPEGSTNIYEALDTALRMANVHSQQTRGEERADVIFLVSDGAPTDSQGRTEDYERILVAVRQWNAMKRIAIHTIGIGKEHSIGFMKRLAEENGGEYYAVLPKKK